jgi:hypothetical protein
MPFIWIFIFCRMSRALTSSSSANSLTSSGSNNPMISGKALRTNNGFFANIQLKIVLR